MVSKPFIRGGYVWGGGVGWLAMNVTFRGVYNVWVWTTNQAQTALPKLHISIQLNELVAFIELKLDGIEPHLAKRQRDIYFYV